MIATTEPTKSIEAPSRQSSEAASASRPSKRLQRGKLTRSSSAGARVVRKASTLKKAAGAPTTKVRTQGKHAGGSGGPTTWSMIVEALKSLNERTGSSRVAILNYLVKNFHVNRDARFLSVLRRTLKGKTEQGALRQIGQSFKLVPVATKQKSEGVARTKSKSLKRVISGEAMKGAKVASKGQNLKRSVKKSVTSKPSIKRGGSKSLVSKKGGISKTQKRVAKPKGSAVGASAKATRKNRTNSKRGSQK